MPLFDRVGVAAVTAREAISVAEHAGYECLFFHAG